MAQSDHSPDPDAGAVDDGSTALATVGEKRPWRGDEHKLQVESAKEAGLPANEVELELFTEGFKAGMTLDDPADKAIVLRGRTVLKKAELKKSLLPVMSYLRVPMSDVAVQVHDGKFELRVAGNLAERAAPALDSAKVALKVWIGFGLVGFLAMQWFQPAAAIIWGLGLILGGYVLRDGLVNGRSMLAGRLVLALGMLAQAEHLILPPAGDELEAGAGKDNKK
jgi:hypothetical protein